MLDDCYGGAEMIRRLLIHPDVELVTSRFRFGETPVPEGYARSELFYPWSSRAFRRSARYRFIRLGTACRATGVARRPTHDQSRN